MENFCINNLNLKIGDKVRILKLTDDSGNASDLYGVESHLNGWVTSVYIEPFEGIICFDKSLLMVVIKNKYNSIPLSEHVRYDCFNGIYDSLSKKDLDNVVRDYKLINSDYDTIIKYIEKI